MNKKQILSVAAGMVMLTACSEYDPGLTKGGVGDYTPAELQLMDKYTENFEARYGKIDENHTWGFGSAEVGAKTRAANPEANQWADPGHGGWIVPPPLKSEQIAVVKKYFQTHKYPTYEDPKWTNYFVQQVYKGGTDPMAGYSPEVYTAANNQSSIEPGEHMDYLCAVEGNFVDHINNFNRGDCDKNNDVLDNGQTVNNGTHHSDKIMLMENSTTKSFGYTNSTGDVVRTEYTGLVSFETIIEALGEEAYCLRDGWNRSFMGFDFELMVDDECYPTAWDSETQSVIPVYSYLTFEGDYYIDGEKKSNYVYQYNGKSVRMLCNQTNQYCGILKEVSDGELYSDYRDANNNNELLGKKLNTEIIDNLLKEGYLPIDDTNNRTWVKIGGCADGYYSDWIVSLAEAKKTPNTPDNPDTPDTPSGETWYRIMCEDLGNTNDFDFNDLVFDVYFTGEPGNYTAHVRVQAAGGTLPIYLAYDGNEAYEAHHLLGMWDETIVPINVGTGNTAAPKDVEIGMATNNPNDINIYVEKKVAENTKETILLPKSGTNRSLNKAPQKICIPNGQNVRWMKEMQQIESAYPHFEDWVQNEWGQYGFNGATPWTTTEVNPSPLY